MTWTAEEILPALDFPRENGTDGLHQAQAVLDSLLHSIQAPAHLDAYSASPHRLVAAGVCLLLSVVGVLLAGARPHLRWTVLQLSGLGLALVFVTGGFDALLPSSAANNILVTVPPSDSEMHSIMIAAHYDSRTAPFDHIGRSILVALSVLLAPVAIVASWRAGSRRRRWALSLPGGLALALLALQMTGGFLIQPRSHGMRDNAAACSLVAELCSRAVHRPLEHTRLQFAWWSGEEIGAQGSQAWTQRNPTTLPDFLINLEALGAGSDVAIGRLEWTGRGLRRPDADLVERLRRSAPGLRFVSAPILTDAGPFLGMGVAAVTLMNLPAGARWPHGLHRPGDVLSSVDAAGVDAARRVVVDLLRSLDAGESHTESDEPGNSPAP